jgi:phospholipid-translocating ATPase
VMASDYAISKFKHLERLVLVHGHWNYDRLSRMVLYFFYKNAAFVFLQFWYHCIAGFSGALCFDQTYLMLYNMMWTSMPPMTIGILDQDATDSLLLSSPELYKQGRLGLSYKAKLFWINMFDAFYVSLVIFFVSYGAYYGTNVGHYEFGTTLLTTHLAVMFLNLAVVTKSWTMYHLVSVVLSVLFFYGYLFFYNGICISCFEFDNPFNVIYQTVGTRDYWLVIILASTIAILPRLLIRILLNTLYPSDITKKLVSEKMKSQSKNGSRPPTTSSSWSRGNSSAMRSNSEATEMTAIIP